MSGPWKEGFAMLNEILNPAVPAEDRFIPPVELLTARTAASARASGKRLPWRQYTGAA